MKASIVTVSAIAASILFTACNDRPSVVRDEPRKGSSTVEQAPPARDTLQNNGTVTDNKLRNSYDTMNNGMNSDVTQRLNDGAGGSTAGTTAGSTAGQTTGGATAGATSAGGKGGATTGSKGGKTTAGGPSPTGPSL